MTRARGTLAVAAAAAVLLGLAGCAAPAEGGAPASASSSLLPVPTASAPASSSIEAPAGEPVRAGSDIPAVVVSLRDRLNDLSAELSATLSASAADIDAAYASAWQPAVDAGAAVTAVRTEDDPMAVVPADMPQGAPYVEVSADGTWCLADIRALDPELLAGDEPAAAQQALAPVYAVFSGGCAGFTQ